MTASQLLSKNSTKFQEYQSKANNVTVKLNKLGITKDDIFDAIIWARSHKNNAT